MINFAADGKGSDVVLLTQLGVDIIVPRSDDFVGTSLNMMNSELKLMDFGLQNDEICIKIDGF